MSNKLLLKDKHIIKYRKSESKQKTKAFLLVLPLLVFLLIFFITPISFVLYKSVYNPKVSDISNNLVTSLKEWKDVNVMPGELIFKTAAYEIQLMQKRRLAGKFAEEVNRRVSQTGSIIKRTARKIKKINLDEIDNYKKLLISLDKRWGKVKIWQAIKLAGDKLTINYYANALDYKINPVGDIVKKPEELRVYLPILQRTFEVSLIVTFLTILIGYPLSYYLSIIPDNKANILLIFVLLPFWTSLLVRTTSWIAILQTDGVINKFLLFIGAIDAPFEIIYNKFATILSMTHILLPFMVLPLYSVMKGIDSTYVRASQSLGANPFMSFIKIYFPMSVPGLNAGALLVFIVAIGYYITPALLGGVDGQLISNLIAFHMRSTNNWELAAALGSILLVLIVIIYWVYDRLVGVSNLKL